LGFELVYADTDSVFLKKDGATRSDYENVMKMLSSETGLSISLDYHYKFLVDKYDSHFQSIKLLDSRQVYL